MRVADSVRYDSFKQNLTRLNEKISRTQNVISSQKKLLDPSDDPVATSRSVEIQAEQGSNDQMKRNLESLQTTGSYTESALSSVSDALNRIEEIAVAQASDTMNADDRKAAVAEVEGIIEELVTLGNTKVGSTYIFGGQRSNTAPFVLNDDYSVDFVGSDQVNKVYVDRGEAGKIESGMTGASAFYGDGFSIFDALKNFRDALDNNSEALIEDPVADPANGYSGTVSSNNGNYYTGAGNKTFLVKITTAGDTTGPLAGRAQYSFSTDGGISWSDELAVNTGGADTTIGDIIIDNTNDTFYVGGSKIRLASGNYTGDDLADEIEDELGAGYDVTYDAGTRKFTITNNTGTDVAFNWSNEGSTAAGVLGFEAKDDTIAAGAANTGDFDAGMFIDGAGIPNDTNGGVKISFGAADVLVSLSDLSEGDQFSIDTQTVKGGTADAEKAVDLVAKNLAWIGSYTSRIETMLDEKETRNVQLSEYESKLVDADLAQAATDLEALTTSYQALIYSISKIESLSLLNYLG